MLDKYPDPMAVLGAGSWGTALALHLSRLNQDVRLWGFDKEHVAAMHKDRVNHRYLPNEFFPDSLCVFSSLTDTLKEVKDILIAVPSIGFRPLLIQLKPLLSPKSRLVWVTKGMDVLTGQLLHDVAYSILDQDFALAILSGPSFAGEVAKGLPTALVASSNDSDFAKALVKRFTSSTLRVYFSEDMIGAEIGGVVKNILAIACGISDGMGFGANARSALITRGLAEMIRLGTALGANADTFNGLTGVGDLVLTCTDNQSRNRRFGLALGKGKNAEEAEKEIGQVVEGKKNAEQLIQFAKLHQVEMPISETVWKILQRKITPNEAMLSLLSRQSKKEL